MMVKGISDFLLHSETDGVDAIIPLASTLNANVMTRTEAATLPYCGKDRENYKEIGSNNLVFSRQGRWNQ